MNISKRLKIIRESYNLSRKEMAEKIYLSYSHYSNIESGTFPPTITLLKTLAENLDLPEEYLLYNDRNNDDLENLLNVFKTNIEELNLKEAKSILNRILNEYFLINSVYQETYFYLLKSYYYYRANDKERSFSLFSNEFSPLIEGVKIEELSNNFREVYYYINAVISYSNGEYSESYNFYLKQLSLLDKDIILAGSYYNIALNLFRLNNNQQAITYANKAFYLYNKEKKIDKSIDTSNLLGALYIEAKDLQNAERILTKAFEIAKDNNFKNSQAKLLHNIGLIFKIMGDFEESLDYFNKSIKIKKTINLNPLKSYYFLIDIYIKRRLLDRAEQIFREAKKYIHDEVDEMHMEVLEAKINLKKENHTIYEKLMSNAIDFLYNNNLLKYYNDNSIELAEYYYKHKKYKLATKYYRIYYKI